jgi:L-alanine-DL-glutamate epimerase-like enolase superfamily enzyme
MTALGNTIRHYSESFALANAFTISRGTKTHAHVVRVEISDGTHTGQGECVPYARYGESIESVTRQIEALPADINRESLQDAMAAGAARNAVDCAFWDLEAKQSGKPVWQLAGLAEPKELVTAYTLSLDEPEKMRASAAKNAHRPLLKLKLGTPNDIPRLQAVREGAPNSTIMVDANEGWAVPTLIELQPALAEIGVALIEQPLPEADDSALVGAGISIPLCADESCHTSQGLEALREKYDVINIKLDKTGGLTEALKMKQKAEAMGFTIFVGCMVGSSLGMAPATLVAQGASFVDLDGPLLLAQDRAFGLRYEGSTVYPPDPQLWG